MPSLFDTPAELDVTHGRGRLRSWTPRPGLYVSHVEGHFDGALCDAFLSVYEKAPKTTRFTSFHDWRGMSGFDRLLPPRLVAFALEYLGRTDRMVVATRSPLVAMAVRAGNLTIRRVELLDDDARFDAELARVVAGGS